MHLLVLSSLVGAAIACGTGTVFATGALAALIQPASACGTGTVFASGALTALITPVSACGTGTVFATGVLSSFIGDALSCGTGTVIGTGILSSFIGEALSCGTGTVIGTGILASMIEPGVTCGTGTVIGAGVLSALASTSHACLGAGFAAGTGANSNQAVFKFDAAPPVEWTYSSSNVTPGQASSPQQAIENFEQDVKNAIHDVLPVSVRSTTIHYNFDFTPTEAELFESCEAAREGNRAAGLNAYAAAKGTVVRQCGSTANEDDDFHTTGSVKITTETVLFENQWATLMNLVQAKLSKKNVKFVSDIKMNLV